MVADQVESFINELQERTSNGRLVWNPVSGVEDWEQKKHRIEKSEDIELKDYFIEDDQSYSYLHTVQTTLNRYKFGPLDKIFGKVDVIDWPKEALFIIVLGLNGLSITMERVDAYTNIINKYQLNRDTLERLVRCIS